MGQIASMQCCHEEQFEGKRSMEFKLDTKDNADLVCLRDLGYEGSAGCWNSRDDRNDNAGSDDLGHEGGAGCWKVQDDKKDKTGSDTSLESLNYMPVRFDASPTVDAERSQARYSKIVAHSTRAPTHRRSKLWEDCLRAAIAGRNVMLLSGVLTTPRHEDSDDSWCVCKKIPAKYYLDRGLTKISVLPLEANENAQFAAIVVLIENIQVICPAIDCMPSFDQVEHELDELERARAVLLQYTADGPQRRRLCFLEESVNAKDRFVQALTSVWHETRNDHSTWF